VLAAQAGAQPTFTSRYADPNHPASNGNLISLVTGGIVNPQPYMRNVRDRRMMALEERRAMAWGGRRDMYGRDMYGRGLYERDMYERDMYGRDMYGRDFYGRPGVGGGFGRPGFGRGFGRRRGLENTGVGMLIGALVDRGSRGQSSSQRPPPQQQPPYYPDEKRQPQDDRHVRQQGQPGMVGPGMGPGRGGMAPPPQRGGPYGYRYGRGRLDQTDNPIALLNPIVGIKRILKQVSYSLKCL
jgi:hypothetical protein